MIPGLRPSRTSSRTDSPEAAARPSARYVGLNAAVISSPSYRASTASTACPRSGEEEESLTPSALNSSRTGDADPQTKRGRHLQHFDARVKDQRALGRTEQFDDQVVLLMAWVGDTQREFALRFSQHNCCRSIAEQQRLPGKLGGLATLPEYGAVHAVPAIAGRSDVRAVLLDLDAGSFAIGGRLCGARARQEDVAVFRRGWRRAMRQGQAQVPVMHRRLAFIRIDVGPGAAALFLEHEKIGARGEAEADVRTGHITADLGPSHGF